MNTKSIKSIFTIILFFISQTATWAQYDPQALEILETMSMKYKKLTSFQAQLTSTLINKVEEINEEFKGQITVKKNMYQLHIGEQQIINNGTTVWTYIPSVNEVTIDHVDLQAEEFNPTQFYDMYKKGFKYIYLQERKERGVICEEIDLVPEKRDAQYFKIKLLIDKKNKIIRNWIMYDRFGNQYHYTITNFTPNVKVPDSYFAFDTKEYPDVEVVDLR